MTGNILDNAALGIADRLERVTVLIGRLATWAAVALMIVILSDVILRRYFVIGSTQLQELEWHLHGTLFLLTLGFAYIRGAHVRIELLREHWQTRTKVWVELFGCLLFFLPYCFAILHFGFDYTAMSYSYGETSASPTGLPYRWIIKGIMVGGFLLLTASGLAILLRCAVYLFAKDPAITARAIAGLENVIEDKPETT